MQDGVPLADAADQLGISIDLLRKRAQRGKVAAYKQDRKWFVVLPQPDSVSRNEARSHQDTSRTEQPDASYLAGKLAVIEELVATLRAEVDHLRTELGDRTEELRRKDIIIADLARRVHALPETVGLSPASQMAAGDERATSANGYQQDGSWWTRVHDLMQRGTA